MRLTLKAMSIILIIILVTSASGIILYREHKIDTTGNIEFYIDSDEMHNITGVILGLEQIGIYNGLSWTNHSLNVTTNLYQDNISSPGLIAEINLPAHNYSRFMLYIYSAEVGFDGSYHNFSLVSRHTDNYYNISLRGGSTMKLTFEFGLPGNLNVSNRTFDPVSTVT